ncbi:endonuclease/exonuclease/phosphatase [Pedobacter sp. HMF7647]|uniref:Endonuclease/exonuclease/phosphatase n=1 Tax=Hufsiella arboris TaxID=2695275 RepID=A0A7K1YBP4_9SPHI|nr:endonuclease/exonuclease/phosphatase family protein [Hufsiella arboris]MXV51781.1 endonuclease/exonuclease/phosphatase [Hufsiella arboris]
MPAKRTSRKKSSLKFFDKLMLTITCVSVACILVSYIAKYIDPQMFWPVAFFGLTYPLLLAANLLLILFWLFRKPLYMLIPLAAILIGYNSLTANIGFRKSTAENSIKSDALRVMTYNVHFFKKFDSKLDTSTRDQILQIIQEEKPDVLCIQEFFARPKGKYQFKKLVREAMGADYFYFFKSTGNDFEESGLAIFSKYPIAGSGHITFPETYKGNEAIYANIKYKNRLVRFYSVHLQSINFQPEDYKYLDEVKEIKANVKSSRRIGSRLKQAFIKRSMQVKVLKEHASGWNEPYLFCGDFNDTPNSYAVNYLADDMNNAFQKKGSGPGITYNGDFPNFQIDFILASKDLNVESYQVIKKKLSDHYAVRSDLLMLPRAK